MEKSMRILTGIDLFFEPSCGSMILCNDVYSNFPENTKVKFIALQGSEVNRNWSKIKDVTLYKVKKITDEKLYHKYVDELYLKIKNELDEFLPDLIHIQHLTFGMALAFSKINEKIPKIAICHGTDVLYSINNDFHRRNVIQVCKASKYVIFPSNEMYNDFKRIIGIDLGSKAKIISWGIPCVEEKNEQKINLDGKINLLYAGRITEDKGVDIIINAMKSLSERFCLTIIGSGTYEENIKKEVKNNKLSKRINFLPFLSRDELWKKFKEYHLLIVSTQEIESFCLVAIEAQGHGLPVVYSNTSGLKEIIGDSGVSFIPKNPIDLGIKIEEIFRSNLFRKLTTKSKENAKKFAVSKTIMNFYFLSKKVVSNKTKIN